jgi:hypothetical protein
MPFQASDITGIYNERVAIALGVAALISALATLGSCRSFVSVFKSLGLSSPLNNPVYRAFYQYHTFYWWALGIILLSHIVMAISHTGLPQAGDSDANVHWAILSLGLVSAVLVLTVFSSCRVYSRIKRMLMPGQPDSGRFRAFFKYHSYYWLIFLLLVVGHFVAGFIHAGIWPGG